MMTYSAFEWHEGYAKNRSHAEVTRELERKTRLVTAEISHDPAELARFYALFCQRQIKLKIPVGNAHPEVDDYFAHYHWARGVPAAEVIADIVTRIRGVMAGLKTSA